MFEPATGTAPVPDESLADTNDGTLLSAFYDRAEAEPERVAIRTLTAGGSAADATLTWAGWAGEALRFAAALETAGHRAGETVAVLAGNTGVWPVSELGALTTGAVTVGVYPTSAPTQLREVLADADARAVVVDTAEQLAKVEAVRDALPRLTTVVCADAAAAAAAGERVVGWSEWLTRGGRALAAGPGRAAALVQRARAARPEALAVLIYTSGSTGEPKGACLTHRYLAASAASVRDTLGLTAADSSLSFLPYSHAAERVFGLYTRVLCGMEAALVPDHTRVWEAARAYGPTVFGGLPRFYEKAYEELEAERSDAGGELRERWDRTIALGTERSRRRQAGDAVPEALEREWRADGEPFFERARARFGGRLRLATSGGAALPREVAERLDAHGITVLGAYGLTEQLCVAFHRPDRYAFDSVGAPMVGAEVRIGASGEVLVRRGALTFAGYRGKPESTRAAFTDDGEWLRTGDLGAIDARGALRIVGREKELIALSTGKKVAPLPTEARLTADPLVSHAVLQGEGRKYVSALLWLRRRAVEAWARSEGLGGEPYEELVRHPRLAARLQEAVDAANAPVSRTEQVRRFAVAPGELTVEAGELTPTLKVRRAAVGARYAALVEALYDGGSGEPGAGSGDGARPAHSTHDGELRR